MSPWAPRTSTAEPEGAFTGEISVADAQGDRLRLLHRGPLRAPRPARRDQRGREPARPRRSSRRGITPIVCVGESLAVRDEGTYRRLRHAPRCARAYRRHGRAPTAANCRCGLRAGLGHRHGPDRHARAGRGGVRRHPRHRGRALRRRRRPRTCACSTAAR